MRQADFHRWVRYIGLVCLYSTAGEALAATFSVAPDGSGDFPTIQSAIDSAMDGDIIELLPGTFRGDGNREIDFLGKDVVLRSMTDDPATCVIDCEEETFGLRMIRGESRDAVVRGITITRGREAAFGAVFVFQASPTVENCRFIGNVAWTGTSGGAISWESSAGVIRDCYFEGNWSGLGGGAIFVSFSDGTEILGCTFRGNVAESAPFGSAGAVMVQQGSPLIEGCLFVDNRVDAGAGALECTFSAFPTVRACTFVGNSGPQCIFSAASSAPTVENCIVAFNEGAAIQCQPGITFSCTDIFGNPGGNWVSCVTDQAGMNGNPEEDPLFCGPDSDDWTLQADSPCAPQNSGGCGLIGALGVGCGPVPVARVSWGGIKSQFSSDPGIR